jgi:hypothetical protein
MTNIYSLLILIVSFILFSMANINLFGKINVSADWFLLIVIFSIHIRSAKVILLLLFSMIHFSGLLFSFGIVPSAYFYYLNMVLSTTGPSGVLYYLLLFLFSLIFLYFIKFKKNNKKILYLSLLVYFLLLGTKFLIGHYSDAIRAPSARFFFNAFHFINNNKSEISKSIKAYESQTPVSYNNNNNNNNFKNIHLTLMESWSENESDFTSFVNHLVNKYPLLNFEHGLVYYKGSTINAEYRELCGLKGDINSANVNNCAKNLFNNKNLYGYHGYLSTFYLRKTLWKFMGFDKVNFYEDYNLKTKCKSAFYAICDFELVDSIFLDSKKNDGVFYLVTIDSHYPINYNNLENSFILNDAYYRKYLDNNKNIPRSLIEYYMDKFIISSSVCDGKRLLVFVGDHESPNLVENFKHTGKVPYLRVIIDC